MRRITCIAVLAAFAAGSAKADVLYTINQSNELTAIHPDTFELTTVGALGTAFSFGDLAYDPALGVAYMVGGLNINNLFTIDLSTGAATLVGSHGLPWVTALGWDSSTGTLYAGQGVVARGFGSLDPATGAAAVINANSGAFMDGLAHDSKRDMLVAASANQAAELYAIDRATGVATLLLSDSSNFLSNGGLTYDPKRDLFWYIDAAGRLFSFDPNDGYAMTLAADNLGQHAGLIWVPSPSTVGCLGLGLLLGARRRR